MKKAKLTPTRARKMFTHVWALQDPAALAYFTLEYAEMFAKLGFFFDYEPFVLTVDEFFDFYYYLVHAA